MHPRLYVLTPDGWSPQRLLDAVARVLDDNAPGWLQYRDKSDLEPVMRLRVATGLRERCEAAGWRFLVNDDVALARACGADGVHLGEQDGELAAARIALGPDALLGASCYDDLERARRAWHAGASYLAFGAFFPSATKPHARQATPVLLAAAREFGLPVCAIGGITADNIAGLVSAGADLLAVIQSVWTAAQPADVVRQLQAGIERGVLERAR